MWDKNARIDAVNAKAMQVSDNVKSMIAKLSDEYSKHVRSNGRMVSPDVSNGMSLVSESMQIIFTDYETVQVLLKNPTSDDLLQAESIVEKMESKRIGFESIVNYTISKLDADVTTQRRQSSTANDTTRAPTNTLSNVSPNVAVLVVVVLVVVILFIIIMLRKK